MVPLRIETHIESGGTKVMKVTGFSEKELSELGSMDYKEMIHTVLDELNLRNGNLGTCWHNGYGVYTMWITGESVYVEIGKGCD